MNKAELINAIMDESGLSKKDSEKALAAVVDAITKALVEGKRVQLVGFGIFDVKERAARTGRNPMTNEPLYIPAARVPQFRAGKALKKAVAMHNSQ